MKYPKKRYTSLTTKEWHLICDAITEKEIGFDKIDWESIDNQGFSSLCSALKEEYGMTFMPTESGEKWTREQREITSSQLEKAKEEEHKIAESFGMQSIQDVQKTIAEVENFNKFCEPISWNTIFSVMNKGRFNVVNAGAFGIGKSRGSKEIVELLKLDTVQILSGHITPAKLFDLLSFGGCIVMDESYSLFINPHIKHLLRSALYDGKVVWYTAKDSLAITFEGSLIFNTNQLSNKTLNDKALLDRCFVNHPELTNQQILEKKDTPYVPDTKIWNDLRNKILWIRNSRIDELPCLTSQEVSYIDTFFKNRVNTSCEKQISMRSFPRVIEIFQRMKWLFGTLDSDLLQYCSTLSEQYIFT
jgi:hypothetical protein